MCMPAAAIVKSELDLIRENAFQHAACLQVEFLPFCTDSCPCEAILLFSITSRQSHGGTPSFPSGTCRIVICGLTGQYIDQIGGNGAALKDGAFDSAAFNRPQGLAFSSKRGRLYVADTENHALREVSAAPAASASPMVISGI